MKRFLSVAPLISALFIMFIMTAGPAFAHFGMVVPSTPIVMDQGDPVELSLSFSHPFEGFGMKLEKPDQFYMVRDGEKTSLLDDLEDIRIMDNEAYRYQFKPARPGVYHFVMEPKPYWEPMEDSFIIHYTKTIIGAFGGDENWQEPLGLPVEIKPLLRPFGNYRGNSFAGQVLIDGKPAPNAEVEVEYYNEQGKLQAPSDYHVTQVVLTDDNGVFSFSCPLSGWWGFAALHTADYTIKDAEGNDKAVELGGVIWVHMGEYLSE
jgi:cobalt/nickel transport protein